MAQLALIFKLTPTSIDVIDVDASVQQVHESTAEVTEHPVEKGADIADHSRPKPDRITIEGIISNTPVNIVQRRRVINVLGLPVEVTTGVPFQGAEGRAEAAERKLRELKDTGTLITVVTRLRTYESMLIESLSFPQDPSTGDALRFSVQMKRVRLVENRLIPFKVSRDPRANAKAKLQKQKTEPDTNGGNADKSNRSIARRLIDGDFEGAGNQAGKRAGQLGGLLGL